MNYKKLTIIAIVLIAGLNLKAQYQTVGHVVEHGENGEELPITGANVYWEGTNTGVTTDSEGYFSIPNPESFPYTLVVSFVGYQKYSKLINQPKKVLSILLSPSIDLEEVKVKGKVNTTKISTLDPINTQTLTACELEKAACCNLSESFTTNATVDVTFTDAVSGAKQIQMLGLDGVYTQITQENMPLIRGMSSSYGLNYVPGTWIESIQIIKGSGSVVNGFESVTGQINLEYYKPSTAPKLYWNAYTNSEGKLENNFLFAKKNGDWKSNLFTHISYFNKDLDHNSDGFQDMPKVKNVNILNKWDYVGNSAYHFSFSARALSESRTGGKNNPLNPYLVQIDNNLFEFASKIGALQPNFTGKSMGLQSSALSHHQKAVFGSNVYDANQESIYVNFIRKTYIIHSDNIVKYGASFYGDRYIESFSGNTSQSFFGKQREDVISGVFTEYTYKNGEFFNLTTGLRADYYNNTEKVYVLPRLNVKYNPVENIAIRLSGGKSFRIANIFAENATLLASNRDIKFEDNLSPEVAWNYGANFTYSFYLNGREGMINLDAYRTDFENQVVVDIEQLGKLSFYNLDGQSHAISLQADVMLELVDGLDVKAAYKINEVRTTFKTEELSSPLTPKNRAMLNIAYSTPSDKWMFDVTLNRVGESRIPLHANENTFDLSAGFSDPFYLVNSQITRKFKKWDIYLGSENITNYTQENPIISASDPSSDIFDASIIHAPIYGRMFYAGLRFKIN